MRKYLFKGPVTTLQNITFIIFVRSKERLTDEEMVRSCLCKEFIFYFVFSLFRRSVWHDAWQGAQPAVAGSFYLSFYPSMYLYFSLKIPRGNKTQQNFSSACVNKI